MNRRSLWLASAAFLLACAWLGGTLPAAAQSEPGKYVGPGSCSASACHGGVQPRSLTHILQNEYTTWIVRDPHAKAFRSLQNDVSKRMGRILKLDPETSQRCLVCHALPVSEKQKGREFDLSEGVSCESCHGPASGWLGPHVLKTARRADSLHQGMIDAWDPLHRSKMCLDCHVGSPTQDMNHELIAAGHPDLVFELDSYSANMPPHWKPSGDANFGSRLLTMGQADKLQAALKRLARRASNMSAPWPEYSDLDCFTCHHSLTKPELSWRQDRGYTNRGSGAPPWNSAHYTVFRLLAREISPGTSAELDKELENVYQTTSKWSPDRKAVADAAHRANGLVERLVSEANGAQYDAARAGRMLRAIADDGEHLASEDTRSAEQAAMALDSLYITYSRQSGNSAAVRSAIDGLFPLLENPSAYSAPKFSAQMKRVSAALREAGVGGR